MSPDSSAPAKPRAVMAIDVDGLVLAEAELTCSGPDPDDPTLHVWTATFPRHVTDALLLDDAHLHIDVLPGRTTVQVNILESP